MYLLLEKYLVCIMKRYRKISYVLGGILFLVVGMLAFQVYESGMEERRICKQKAEVSLKSATELWANREFDKLGIPYSVEGAEKGKQAASYSAGGRRDGGSGRFDKGRKAVNCFT